MGSGRAELRRRGSEPKLAERYYRRMSPLVFVAIFSGMGLMMSSMFFGWPLKLSFGSNLVGLLVVAILTAIGFVGIAPGIWLALILRWEKRLMARVYDSGYKLCPNCGYPLNKSTGATTCPECGVSCDMREVEDSWRAFRPRVSSLLSRQTKH